MATCGLNSMYDPRIMGYEEQCAREREQERMQQDYRRLGQYMTVTNGCSSIQQQLCPKKKTMNIKLIAKKALSPDLRTLIKAGVLDNDLSINNTEFVLQFIVNKYLKEMAAEAKAHMAELKEEDEE